MAITKARYWTGVLYPENMRSDWQDVIGDILGVPYAYCIHDKDMLGEYEPKQGEEHQRKEHVHLMVVFAGPTTYNHALNIMSSLSEKGKQAINTCEACHSVRNTYEYLIHNTETSKKQGKYLYSESERVCGNNFDIGAYEQLSVSDKNRMAKELCDFISDNGFTNFMDFYDMAMSAFSFEYFEIVKSYSGLFDRLCKGAYLKTQNPHANK